MKIGEFKQEIKSQWGNPYQMMRGGYGGYGMDLYQMPMMGWYGAPKTLQSPTVPPATN